MSSIADVIADHEVIVCAGSGGVGKTTTAAAIGLLAAEAGRRCIVLTIDPAKRLADALGISELGNEPKEVAIGKSGTLSAKSGTLSAKSGTLSAKSGALSAKSGALSAMMLDQKGAWDALVERYAESEEARERILANAFYQNLSSTFAGSQEYMAIEQLAQLHDSGVYDLIVVDTPPTHHALDFLDAPQRLGNFLDRRVMKWFVRPSMSAGWSGFQVVNRTAGSLLRRLEDATGVKALADVSEFFHAMSSLFEGWDERVQRVEALLRSRDSAFFLVATPEEQVLSEADYFCSKIEEHSITLRGVLFNRVQTELAPHLERIDESEISTVIGDAVTSPSICRRLVQNFARYETQARGDQLRIEQFRADLAPTLPVASIPNFDQDLHDLDGLRRVGEFLVEEV